MNSLTSTQRKIVYLIGIAILMIPIIAIGMPSSRVGGSPGDSQGMLDGGGVLAQMRTEHNLDAPGLGEVDPTSATMNLVLLGLRGVAANVLWIEMLEQKKVKNWAQMRATTRSITKLQPHFIEVWRFNSWNMAFNVSAEWDAVEDRYWWVKEGTKFGIEGVKRNDRYPELSWDVGRYTGQKVGHSDEKAEFRDFFRKDPDQERYDNGPDPEINPADKGNYLVAKDWWTDANSKEDSQIQHIMARALFRMHPSKAKMDHAAQLQEMGIFGEKTEEEWRKGLNDLTQVYGKELYDTLAGDVYQEISSPEQEIPALAKKNGTTEEEISHRVSRLQNMTNYRYWRARALSELDPDIAEAHHKLYLGEEEFRQQNFEDAEELLLDGAEKYKVLFEKKNFKGLADDDLVIEKALWTVLILRKIHSLTKGGGQPFPEDYPLRDVWVKHASRVPDIMHTFNRRYGRF